MKTESATEGLSTYKHVLDDVYNLAFSLTERGTRQSITSRMTHQNRVGGLVGGRSKIKDLAPPPPGGGISQTSFFEFYGSRCSVFLAVFCVSQSDARYFHEVV